MSALVVDTSALVAILFDEDRGRDLLERLAAADSRVLSAASRVEFGIVVESRLPATGQDLVERLVRDADIEVADVDAELAARALSAWRRYGKGRHPAGLNFGDCFSYGLAERTGLPLLYTGSDFAKTDLDVISPE